MDVFGGHRGLEWQILGVDPAADAAAISALRAEAVSYASVLALAAVCIGFGFERRGVDDDPEEGDGAEGDVR